jgi:hypothetical protein
VYTVIGLHNIFVVRATLEAKLMLAFDTCDSRESVLNQIFVPFELVVLRLSGARRCS